MFSVLLIRNSGAVFIDIELGCGSDWCRTSDTRQGKCDPVDSLVYVQLVRHISNGGVAQVLFVLVVAFPHPKGHVATQPSSKSYLVMVLVWSAVAPAALLMVTLALKMLLVVKMMVTVLVKKFW